MLGCAAARHGTAVWALDCGASRRVRVSPDATFLLSWLRSGSMMRQCSALPLPRRLRTGVGTCLWKTLASRSSGSGTNQVGQSIFLTPVEPLAILHPCLEVLTCSLGTWRRRYGLPGGAVSPDRCADDFGRGIASVKRFSCPDDPPDTVALRIAKPFRFGDNRILTLFRSFSLVCVRSPRT